MLDILDLKTLLLAELVLILFMACGLLLIYALRQRRFCRRVLDEYRKLKSLLPSGPHPDQSGDSLAPASSRDAVTSYFAQMQEEAQARFYKHTQAKIPRLAPDLPFSAKVAGLRHLYAQAELDALGEGGSQHGRWMQLERKLAEVVRWVGQNKPQHAHGDNRLRLLQERIDALKPFEVENIRLQKQLAQTRAKQKRMELHQTESRKTIASLEKIIRTLQKAGGGTLELGSSADALLPKMLESLDQAYDQSQTQLNTIGTLSGEKRGLISKLAEELQLSKLYTPEQLQKLDDIIKSLEMDLLKSDHHVSSLQKELKSSREKSREQPLFIVERNDKKIPDGTIYVPAPGEEPSKKAQEKVEDVLRVVHTNLAEGERQLTKRLNELDDESDRERIKAEIQQLRQNNQNQRNLIIDLEKELRILRREANETQDEAVSEAKRREITQLEKLVKECEHCIVTLESEVDLLHKQLEETQKLSTLRSTHSEPEIIQMNLELERLTHQLQKTVKQYQDANLLNRFSLEVLECDDLESIARKLVDIIKEMHLVVGFYMKSAFGHADYYAGNHFTPQEKLRVKKSPPEPPIGYLNEGVLFANTYIKLLLKHPPETDDGLAQMEVTLGGLCKMVAERLKLLETGRQLTEQRSSLGEWINSTKSHLTELDIQYAYQTEESRRVIDQLIKELQRATEMLDLSGATKTVFDNAIGECQQRISMILNGGKIMDQDFAQLFADLEEIHQRSH